MNISIKFNKDGYITNLCFGEKGGSWISLDESVFPDGGKSVWSPDSSSENEGMTWRLFYRPETPNDEPPSEYNDEPGPPGWHAQSTDTIGVVFEKIENDEMI